MSVINFQHLNKPQSDAQAYGFSGRRMQRMHQLQQSVEEEQPSECCHSDAHLIAVSKEATQNPIQAFHLIAEGIPPAGHRQTAGQRSPAQSLYPAGYGEGLSWLGTP
jgi:hypothetical protein